MERQAFIKLVGGAAGAYTLCPDAVSGTEKTSKAGKLRKLARDRLSVFCPGPPVGV